MARIPYFDMSQLPDETTQLLQGKLSLHIYRMLAHAPTIAPGFLAMARAVFHELSLSRTLSEMATLRVGSLCNAPYEIHQHRRLALAADVPPWKIDAAIDPAGSDRLSPEEQTVLAFTDAVVRAGQADDALFQRALVQLGERGVTELTLVVGFYLMVSRFLNTMGVEIEPMAA